MEDLFGKEMDGLTETGDKAKWEVVEEEEAAVASEETEVEEAAVEEEGEISRGGPK